MRIEKYDSVRTPQVAQVVPEIKKNDWLKRRGDYKGCNIGMRI